MYGIIIVSNTRIWLNDPTELGQADEMPSKYLVNLQYRVEDIHVVISKLNKDLSIHNTHTVSLNELKWRVEQPLVQVQFSDTHTKSQYEHCNPVVQYLGRRNVDTYHMRYNGGEKEFTVDTVLEHSLRKHMLPMEKVDTSKFLLCPMPGSLVACSKSCSCRCFCCYDSFDNFYCSIHEYATWADQCLPTQLFVRAEVQEGQMVEVGQELVTVEAMKMQVCARVYEHCQNMSTFQQHCLQNNSHHQCLIPLVSMNNTMSISTNILITTERAAFDEACRDQEYQQESG